MNDTTIKKGFAWLIGYIKDAIANCATRTWVENKGYLTLNDLPTYDGGVS